MGTLESIYGQGEEFRRYGIKEVTEAGTVARLEDVQIGELKYRALKETYF